MAQARQARRDQLGEALSGLASAGLAGTFSFDEAAGAFRAELNDAGRDQLVANPLVGSVEAAPTTPTPAAVESQLAPLGGLAVEEVSSVVFAQVYSPFVWGRASIGGLTVQLTLEDGSHALRGVPQGLPANQACTLAPNCVNVDRGQLYFETVFVDPTTHQPVPIRPGDYVHVITSGVDPAQPDLGNQVNPKYVQVDDVHAWTSYEQDSVSGTAPPGATVIVTVGSLSLSSYLTPGNGMTYAEVTADSSGSFSAPTFRTTTATTYKKVGLQQGSTGFVRVRHPSGDEVFTIHGQNILPLENSRVLHGYTFGLPSAPGGLMSGVTATRPGTAVTFTLKDSQGQVKGSATAGQASPYTATFPAMISGGDTIEASFNDQGSNGPIAVAPITARVDLGANQVVGSGPASTQIVLGVGRISGFISAMSTFDYIQQRLTTDGSGAYASGQIQCGTSNHLTLKPGSFGYAGYEDAHGNFIYMAYAAPVGYVMADFPFVEGWAADGAVQATVRVQDSSGSEKQPATAASQVLGWLTGQKLFINVYYNQVTSQFVAPGDTVTIVSGSQTHIIRVDRITTSVDTEADVISGGAPAGATVRVVPAEDRSARREVVVDASGAYRAGNPFTYFTNSSCAETTKNEDFTLGKFGRVYVRHDDGNEVFAAFYTRSMNVNENENYLELYPFVLRGLDWWQTPVRSVATTLTPRQGSPTTVNTNSTNSANGLTKISIADSQGQKVLIRAGDSLSATFDEGPNGVTRQASLAMSSLPLITGSPDTDTSTLAGIGPLNWYGYASLTAGSATYYAGFPYPRTYSAWGPIQFLKAGNVPVTLVPGYSGNVTFIDTASNRVWIAWGVTTFPVKIIGWLRPGDAQVCGKAPAGSTVHIYDVTDGTLDHLIGTSTADAQGQFCVAVSPPLYANQVVMAEASGVFSQPVVILPPVFLPILWR
jgi:hypothetical protein